MHLVALWDFTAREADEMSLREGDIISDATPSQADPEWWWGRAVSSLAEGIFPRNYAEEFRGAILPAGWEAGEDDGDTYYFNRATQESVWELSDIQTTIFVSAEAVATAKLPSRPAGHQSMHRSPRASRASLPGPNVAASVGRAHEKSNEHADSNDCDGSRPFRRGEASQGVQRPSVAVLSGAEEEEEEERGEEGIRGDLAQPKLADNACPDDELGSLDSQSAAADGDIPLVQTVAMARSSTDSKSGGSEAPLPILQQPNALASPFPKNNEEIFSEEGSGSDGEISSLARSSILRTVVNGVNAADNLVITAPNKSQVRSEIDGETLQLIANLVDMRLTNEFRRRDAVIADMTSQMARLREQLHAQAQKRQAQLSLSEHEGDGHLGEARSGDQRRPNLPRIGEHQHQHDQKYRFRQQPNRQYEFDDNLPRVAMLKARRSDYVDEREVEHSMAARLAVRYPQCKSAVYPPSLEAASSYRLKASLELDHIQGYSGDWGRDPSHQSRMNNALILKSGEFIFPAAGVVIILDVALNQQRFFRGHSDEVSCLAKHPNGTVVASAPGSMNASIHVWSAESSEVEPITEITLGRRSKGVQALDFSPDGKLLCCVDRDNHHTVTM